MNAVVTGSSGFIGSHLVEALCSRGLRVVGVDRRPPPEGAPGTHVGADLSTRAGGRLLTEVVRDAQVVFHLAALPGVRDAGPRAWARRRRDNVVAAKQVVRAVPLDVPLVVTSSSSVYGGALTRAGGLRPSAEDDVPDPRGGYARSKVEVERCCGARAATGGLVAVARPFTVAGPGQRPDMAVARWLADASAGRPLEVHGSLGRRRDVTGVGDVVRGLIRMAEVGMTGTVNLGTGKAWTLREIVDAVASAVGSDGGLAVEVVPSTRHDSDATLADTRRCRDVLGFVPAADLTALVRRQWTASSGQQVSVGSPAKRSATQAWMSDDAV